MILMVDPPIVDDAAQRVMDNEDIWLFGNERGLPAQPAECLPWLLDPQQHIRVCGLPV